MKVCCCFAVMSDAGMKREDIALVVWWFTLRLKRETSAYLRKNVRGIATQASATPPTQPTAKVAGGIASKASAPSALPPKMLPPVRTSSLAACLFGAMVGK